MTSSIPGRPVTTPRRPVPPARATAGTRRRTLAALVLGVSTALGACSGGGAPTAATSTLSTDVARTVSTSPAARDSLQRGGTLTLPISQLPANWNMWEADGNLAEISTMMQATDPRLYDVAPDGTMSPDANYLLKMPQVAVVDGREQVTYTLNPKARWNDGTPIDWTAFRAMWLASRASVDVGKFNNVATAGYEDIDRVERGKSANEVVVTFKKPFYPVTEVFQGLIHPKVGASAEVFNNAFTNNAVHNEWRSGPFRFAAVDPNGRTITLERNPSWWGARPLLDKIVYRELADTSTIPAFKNGELDAVDVATAARLAQVQGAADVDVRRGQRLATTVYVFNSKAPGLADVAVRKALWQAFDRTQWRKVRFAGLGWSEPDLGSVVYLPFQKQYRDDFPVEQGADKAAVTLEAAGYRRGADGYFAKGGTRLTVRFSMFGDDPSTTAVARLARQQAQAAGVDLVLDSRPAAAFGQALGDGDYGILLMGGSNTSPDPVGAVCQIMCTDGAGNLSGTGSPALDRRIAQVGGIADPQEQAKEVAAIERDWMASGFGMMPLATGPEILAVRRGLANYGPAGFADLSTRWENVGWRPGTANR